MYWGEYGLATMYANDLPEASELKAQLTAVAGINRIVMESFKQDIGKTVKLRFKSHPKHQFLLRINAVRANPDLELWWPGSEFETTLFDTIDRSD